MADSFDPYHKWLGISPKDQPPNHYRLLGIELFESDPDVIEGAADQRMSHVRTFQAGQNSTVSQRILNELSAAKLCLLNPQKKAEYDRNLREKVQRSQPAAPVLPLPPDPPAGAPGRGEGVSPRSLPQAKRLPVTDLPLIVADSPPSTSSILKQKRSRKPPLWQQPLALSGVSAAVVLATAIYLLIGRGKSPAHADAEHTSTNHVAAAKRANGNAQPKKAGVPAPKVSPPRPPIAMSSSTTQIGARPLGTEAADDSRPTLAGEPSDLLRQIDVTRDAVAGEWQISDGVLVSPGVPFARLLLPPPPAPEYQVTIVGERVQGGWGLALAVVVDGHQTVVEIDGGFNGHFTGLTSLDGKTCSENETARQGRLLVDGKAATLVYTIRRNGIQLTFDGSTVIDWHGDPSRLSMIDGYKLPDPTRLALCEYGTACRISKIEIAPLASAPAVAAKGTVDLLKQIDPKRDAVSGDWSVKDGVLLSPAAEFACLALPPPPSAEYRLTVGLERMQGIDTFSVGLPVGNHQVIAAIDAWDGNFSGLEKLDDKSCYDNETARQGHLLEPGRRYTLVYTVRANGVKLDVNGETVINWTGDPARLSTIDVFKSPDPRQLVIGTAHNALFHISKLEIVPLAPEGTMPKDTLAPMPPERKFSDLASRKPSRVAVPDEAVQKQARQGLLKKVAAAKAPEQKRKLARQFLEEASLAASADANVYVLLSQAADLAEASGDLDLAWQAIDQLANAFAVHADDLRQKSLTEIAKTAKSPERCRELVDAACRLMASALVNGETDVVKKTATQAQSLAKRSKDKTLQKDLSSRTAGATRLAGELDAVATARETLQTAPDDAHANFVVGHWQLCVEDDWEPALVKLAKGDDAGWKKLAADSRPLVHDLSDPNLQIATADAWWDAAEKEPWPGRPYLRLHAANWYRLAMPSLTGPQRAHAEERLKLLLATDEGLPAWELFNGGQIIGGFRRITRGGEMRTHVEYDGPIDVTFVARTDSLNIRLVAYGHVVVIWNWELNPSDLRVHRPDGSIVPAPVKPLEPDRWYELHYRITPQGTTITVDGVPVFTENRVYNKFPRGPVGVTSFGDAVVDVKKFVVEAVE